MDGKPQRFFLLSSDLIFFFSKTQTLTKVIKAPFFLCIYLQFGQRESKVIATCQAQTLRDFEVGNICGCGIGSCAEDCYPAAINRLCHRCCFRKLAVSDDRGTAKTKTDDKPVLVWISSLPMNEKVVGSYRSDIVVIKERTTDSWLVFSFVCSQILDIN